MSSSQLKKSLDMNILLRIVDRRRQRRWLWENDGMSSRRCG